MSPDNPIMCLRAPLFSKDFDLRCRRLSGTEIHTLMKLRYSHMYVLDLTLSLFCPSAVEDESRSVSCQRIPLTLRFTQITHCQLFIVFFSILIALQNGYLIPWSFISTFLKFINIEIFPTPVHSFPLISVSLHYW